jgi:hypothetical protein
LNDERLKNINEKGLAEREVPTLDKLNIKISKHKKKRKI